MQEIYEPINKSLNQIGALMSAAEAQGLLCGLLCQQILFSHELWLTYVLGETIVTDGLATECERQLSLLKNYTRQQLNSTDCDFQPLLPTDDTPLAERIQAIGGWCEGLSLGLGITEIPLSKLSPEAHEFIQDVIAISKIAPIAEDVETAEKNYYQLVEYIRIGFITLYEEAKLLVAQESKHG